MIINEMRLVFFTVFDLHMLISSIKRVAPQGNNQILLTLSLTIYYNQYGNKFGTNFSSYTYTIKEGPLLNVSLEERKAKVAELSDITKRMYELRKEFIDGVTTTTIKKNFTEILSFWMYRQACDSSYLDEEDVWKVIGIAEEDYENEDYELAYETVFSLVKKSPEIMFWKMVCLSENDRENNGYYQSWYGKHDENDTLTEWYEFLEKLGYEMSDEEKALRDGTHELFITEESE